VSALRWMKRLCLACAALFLLGTVAHAFSMGAFKSLKHVSQHPKPERLPKEFVADFDEFARGLDLHLGSVLQAIYCYALLCLAERFAVCRKPTPAEQDYDDGRRRADASGAGA
jgi:hypothetical protein